MQKWEYLTANTMLHKKVEADFVVTHVNGKAAGNIGTLFSKTTTPNVWDFLNAMGKEGWELVGGTQDVLFLKRPT